MSPRFLLAASTLVITVLGGCDGVATGEKAYSESVTEAANGGYGPIKLALSPQMSPVAVNLRAEHGINPSDAGKWNTYMATLTLNGREVAASKFNINYAGTADGQPGAPYILQNMLTAKVAEAGDYELSVVPIRPNAIKLTNVRVEMRRNVEGNANLR
ncbi:MAG: hypothetical protein ABL931_04420 [Usitatibacteraceae bacterium]